jgi:glycosyltransferase involved in cell wall biosynthesis
LHSLQQERKFTASAFKVKILVETNQDKIINFKTDSVVLLAKPLVVVGIPALNAEKTIARVILVAQKYADIIVVCDDGSKDMTGEIAGHLGAVMIKHECNSGYGAAIQSLFKCARELRADVLVTLDSDGQHDPAEIPRLVKPIEEGIAEVVLGSRFLEKNGRADMPVYRQFGVKVITKIATASDKKGISDAQSGFRAYSKRALQDLSISENSMSVSVELLRAINKSKLKVCEVPISCKYADRIGLKTSTENPVKHGVGLIMSLVKLVVEDRPLPFLGIPGLLILIAGIFFGVWMMDLYATSHQIVTNVALASIAFVLIGFFMISTAITLYAITKLSQKQNNHE